MQTLIDFFLSLGGLIKSLVDFVIGIVEDIAFMAKMLGLVIAHIPNYFSWLPAPVISLFLLILGVVVVYKIIGREG